MQFQIHANFADDSKFNIVLPKLLREKPHVVQQASSIDDLLQKDLSRSLLDVNSVEITVPRSKVVTVGELIIDDVLVIQQKSAKKRSLFVSLVAWCSNCCRK